MMEIGPICPMCTTDWDVLADCCRRCDDQTDLECFPVTFRVDGIPAPQGSKRHVGGGRMIESSKKLKPWRAAVHTAAVTALSGAEPLTGLPVYLRLDFVLPRPVQTAKHRPTPPAVKRPDLDKLCRAVLDALTGVAYTDDSQVSTLWSTKRIAEAGEQPGVAIRIEVNP
jgi:crossover junction endodeoxyribonuclease RusA